MTVFSNSPRKSILAIVEVTWIVLSLALAVLLDSGIRGHSIAVLHLLGQVVLLTSLYLVAFYYSHLDNFFTLRTGRETALASIRAVVVAATALALLHRFTGLLTVHPVTCLLHLLLTVLGVAFLRPHLTTLLAKYGAANRIAIVGTGSEARRLASNFLERHDEGHEVCCMVGTDESIESMSSMEFVTPNPGIRRIPVISADLLPTFAREARLSHILVAKGDLGTTIPIEQLLCCKAMGMVVEDGHAFCQRLQGKIALADVQPEWVLFPDDSRYARTLEIFKRVVDVTAALSVLIFTLPLSLFVVALIKIEDRGPVFFRQTRLGHRGLPFTLYKLRSMHPDAEAETGPVWAQRNDPRITRVGRWIRPLRIDEIPQAWNVLRGEMSIVGPRPERPEFISRLRTFLPLYDHRHIVRPGITGWAQVNLPYTATVEEAKDKLEYDLYYIKNLSMMLDLFILLRTVKIILFGWGSR
jgi:sugar transferase (PEP-CTERM system associated)